MTEGQLLEAFIGQLLKSGVTPEVIELAVIGVRDLPLGARMSAGPMERAFANEQAGLLRKTCGGGARA